MKIDRSFLRSKVARRIFVLFILCAMIPISCLALLSYFQVSEQLKTQSMERLYNSVKTHGMSIYERFLFLETNLKIVSTALTDQRTAREINMEKLLGEYGNKRFNAVGLMTSSGEIIPLYGELKNIPKAISDTAKSNDSDKTNIFFQDTAVSPSQVYMAIRQNRNDPESNTVIGQIETSYLWGIGYENMLPPMTDLCVVDQFRKILVSSFSVSDTLLHQILTKKSDNKFKFFEYSVGGKKYFVSYWSMFLKSGFDAPNVSIVLRRSTADVLSPIANFKKIFPLVVLLSIWIVLFLSVYHIRKSLVPLERLKEGTLRVAKNDFKSQVSVNSHDEFEDLADSFNSMSRQLGRHFDALMTRSEIDRAILSSLSVKKIVNTALKRIYYFFSCDAICINLAVDKKPTTHHGFILTDTSVRKTQEEFFTVSLDDQKILSKNLNHLQVDLNNHAPTYLPQAALKNMTSFLVLPLFLNTVLKGTIALGFMGVRDYSDDDLKQARQIADQLTIALSNSSLVTELEKLNLGTLEALARTVDAKSSWTAGHSERVTHLSVKIAHILGLEQQQIDILQRAAFLHDIGKIGTPLAILDKPDRLTDEEFEKIKEHPVIGAQILEPIEAYAEVIPIVLQHHEKYNGKGYPHGIEGEKISIGARILAVADVYDAVVSDRPYRHGWIEEKAVNMIKKEAGVHFDPTVVDAFLVAISE